MSKKILSDQDFLSASRILNLPAPSDPNEPARLADLNAAIEGLKEKDPVMVRTQANINLASPGATVDGETLTSGDRELGSFLAANQTDPAENGLYIWNGAATPATRAADASTAAELNGALVKIKAGTDSTSTWRQTATIVTLGTDAVNWTAFNTAAAQATESLAGVAEIATQAEADAGTDDQRIVTSLKLANWSGRKRKGTAVIGDGAATQYDITHNFGTRDVIVEVARNATPWDTVLCDVSRPDANTVRLNFTSAPTSNQFIATVIG